jgi:uncharacterized SAM-binding protein YcdF (DUF218 family)
MRLLLWLFIWVIMFIVAVMGIGSYLAPDGLSQCEQQPSARSDCQAVDAIVAISGGDTRARTAEAIDLYKNGWANLMVFSGAAADKTGPSNAEAMMHQALEAGVPATAILLDETSETTKENAANTSNLFASNNIQSVILVTSAYHQRRAGLEFAHRAGNDVRIINHPVKADNQWNGWWWTTPTGWWLASGEIVKILFFYAGVSR